MALVEDQSLFVMMSFRSGSRARRLAEWTETSYDITVSQYLQEYIDCGGPRYIYVARHPLKSLKALGALCRLPCLQVAPSFTGSEAAAVYGPLSRHSLLARHGGFVTTALKLPDEPEQYSQGAAKQTLRRKVRFARRLGVTWTEITDYQERRRLLDVADDYERNHPNVKYRNAHPDNARLFKYRLWLAAYSASGYLLLLSVTPFDGELAMLTYFRTTGSGDEQSNARYLMTQVLAEKLTGLGVRYLMESGSPAMTSGLRHFQRMIGFHLVRIRIKRSVQQHGSWEAKC